MENRTIIKPTVEGAQEKRQALLTMMQGKPLYKVSRAYALFIPRLWLRLYGWELDDRVWVKVDIEVDKITITPIDKEEALSLMEVNNVKPDES